MRTFTLAGSLEIIGYDYREIDSIEYPTSVEKLIGLGQTLIARKIESKNSYSQLRHYNKMVSSINNPLIPKVFYSLDNDNYRRILDRYMPITRKTKLNKIKYDKD